MVPHRLRTEKVIVRFQERFPCALKGEGALYVSSRGCAHAAAHIRVGEEPHEAIGERACVANGDEESCFVLDN